jgi:hypothetical protein
MYPLLEQLEPLELLEPFRKPLSEPLRKDYVDDDDGMPQIPEKKCMQREK